MALDQKTCHCPPYSANKLQSVFTVLCGFSKWILALLAACCIWQFCTVAGHCKMFHPRLTATGHWRSWLNTVAGMFVITIRDVNFVFFPKIDSRFEKIDFFRLSNLCVVRCRLPLYSEVVLTSWCRRRTQQSVNTACQLSLWSCRRADGRQRCADCGLEYFRSADGLWIFVDVKLRIQILILYGRWVKFYNWVFFSIFRNSKCTFTFSLWNILNFSLKTNYATLGM